jgi:hypothetical protein
MSENTAAAQAPDTVDAEFTEDTSLVRSQAQLAIKHEMSPESLKAEIARQTEMQQIMVQYVRDHMVKDHHYYSFNEGGKPALTKDGAHRICSLFKVIPGPVDIEIIREGGGHFTVVSRAVLLNQDGIEIASSRGSASTRESKYAYRWVWHDKMPADIDRASLKTKGSGPKLQYQVPNPDLADLENTIIKMSEKRATVGAVNKLPLVSELFAADPDDHVPESKGKGRKQSAVSDQPSAKAAKAPPAEQGLPLDQNVDELRASVEGLLTLKIGDADRADYLKGRDPKVMLPSALVSMQADLAAM